MHLFVSLICGVILATEPVESWVVKESLGSAAVQVRAVKQAEVAQPFALRVIVTAPPDVEVDEPQFTADLTGAKVTDRSSSGPDPTGEYLSRGWQYLVTPEKLGELKLPSVRVTVHPKEGEPLHAELNPPAIEVVEELTRPGEVDLPPVSIGTPTNEEVTVAHYLLWIGFGLLITVVVVGIWALVSSKPGERR
ncbi:hypothetical protein K2Y11_23450 [bacterium]|nr:hypothetical protein [bacterium]